MSHYPEQFTPGLSSASWSNAAPPVRQPEPIPPANQRRHFLLGMVSGFLVAVVLGGVVWLVVSLQTPDIASAAKKAGFSSSMMEGDSFTGVVQLSDVDQLPSLFRELGVPASTMDRIRKTRPLDGTQEAAGDGVIVHWSYNPDQGLYVSIDPSE